MTRPRPHNSIKHEAGVAESVKVVPPIFRLGNDRRNHEMLNADRRILSWELSGDGEQLAKLAGWDIFPKTFDNLNGFIEIPVGTRNARSVLSGSEAWAGEKQAIVQRAEDYLSDVYLQFGSHDTGFSWEGVGITPDQVIFVAPPNVPSPHDQDTQTWKQTTITELGLLLRNDEQNSSLVNHFAQILEGIDGDVS